MKKLFVVNGINSELGQFFVKKIIQKNYVIGFYRKRYNGLTNKNLFIFNKINNSKKISSVINKCNKIIFINFAAQRDESLLVNLDENKSQEIINSNILSALSIIKNILPHMIKNEYGRIIFLSSKKAEYGSKGNILYSFSKVGLQGISKTLAKEYAKFNITSNVISLGYFDTKMWKSLKSNIKKDLLENTLNKKLGNPNVLVDTIKLIVNHSFINSSKLDIDGGTF